MRHSSRSSGPFFPPEAPPNPRAPRPPRTALHGKARPPHAQARKPSGVLPPLHVQQPKPPEVPVNPTGVPWRTPSGSATSPRGRPKTPEVPTTSICVSRRTPRVTATHTCRGAKTPESKASRMATHPTGTSKKEEKPSTSPPPPRTSSPRFAPRFRPPPLAAGSSIPKPRRCSAPSTPTPATSPTTSAPPRGDRSGRRRRPGALGRAIGGIGEEVLSALVFGAALGMEQSSRAAQVRRVIRFEGSLW
jgi:hypothetical protein